LENKIKEIEDKKKENKDDANPSNTNEELNDLKL